MTYKTDIQSQKIVDETHHFVLKAVAVNIKSLSDQAPFSGD